MEKKKSIDINRYAYLTGRIRALEASLIDGSRLSRYYEARTIEDIGRLLVENGYPAALDPEASLSRGLQDTYALARKIAPDPSLIDLMLMARDFHNLKVMLKSFAVYWPRRQGDAAPGNAESTLDMDRALEDAGPLDQDADPRPTALWPEIHAPVTLEQLEPLLQSPSTIEPAVLFRALRERRTADLPPEITAAASAATARYLRSYDISEIDIHLDRTHAHLLSEAAARVDSRFIQEFVQLRIDLANVGLLMRTRFLKSGADYLQRILLPGGSLSPKTFGGLYEAPDSRIVAALARTPLAPLAEAIEQFHEGGDAIARFSQAQDDVLMRYVQKGKRVLRGPEVIIGYLVAREMETRTVRIILTCLRNGIPVEKARELARLTYL